jgi:hypothetical protein
MRINRKRRQQTGPFDKVRNSSLTARVGTVSLNLLDQLVVVNNTSENDVLSVQPRGLNGGDEELGSVGVGSSVGHRQETGGLSIHKTSELSGGSRITQ